MRLLVCLLFTAALGTAYATPPPPSEVVVIGTIHAPWQFRSAEYTPAHIRAALAAVKPDLIGVESNPAWFAAGKFHEVTYEAQVISAQYAKARKIPIHGVDWMDVISWDQREQDHWRQRIDRILESRDRDRLHPAHFGSIDPLYFKNTEKYFKESKFDFDLINVDESEEWHRRHLRGDPNAPDFGGRRNQEIVKHCLDLMARHPTKRLAVVIGAGHKAVLDKLFARHEGVEVIKVPQLTAKQIDAAWTDEDVLATLGHNLDGERSYFHPELIDLARMSTLLKRLPKSPARRYFGARLLMARERYKMALLVLDRLQDAKDPPDLYPFPMTHWRMRYSFGDAVNLERARCLIALDQMEKARAILKEVGKDGPVDAVPASAAKLAETTRVRNSDFRGALTESPDDGWYVAPKLREKLKIEVAEQGLEMTMIEPPAKGAHYISQNIDAAPGEQVQIRLEGGVVGVAKASLVISVWDETTRSAKILDSRTIQAKKNLTVCTVNMPSGSERAIVHIYFLGRPGTMLRLQRATAFVGEAPPPIERMWIPRRLSREFPVTLAKSG